MAYSLIDHDDNAVPLMALGKAELAAWRESAAARERDWVQATGFTAETGKTALVPDKNGKLARVLVGTGDNEATMWAVAGLSETLPEGSYRLDPLPKGADTSRVALGWALGTYAFTRYHAKKPGAARLVWPKRADRGYVERLAGAVFLARDLATTPASDMGPEELAEAAQQVARAEGAKCKVIVGDKLLEKNYPTIHAVGRASTRAPRLVDISWGDKDAPKVTLVGKGVCFDSGGLDLKPASSMLNMKKDMAGAAIMLGLGQAVMRAALKLRLRVLLPCVENSVSGNAFRPRDIIKTRKGLTVEIGNTDAEGRLILCDALSEASDEKPGLIIDAATLTGAARVALGPELPPFYTDDETLAADLARHARAEHDPLWRLPLWRPYDTMLDSKVADLNNIATGGFAGSIICALFLKRFVAAAKTWLHFDIYAWTPTGKPGRPEGGECQAARALYALLAERFAR